MGWKEDRRQEYAQKLKDPRWQKKRLRILERDGWACLHCKASDDTLHVHHRFYSRDSEPWEYPDRALETLCERCHQIEHDNREESERLLLLQLKASGFRWTQINGLSSGINSATKFMDEQEIIWAFIQAINSESGCQAVLNWYREVYQKWSSEIEEEPTQLAATE